MSFNLNFDLKNIKLTVPKKATAAIFLDHRNRTVQYFTHDKSGDVILDSAFYRSISLSGDFFTEFSGILKEFGEKYPHTGSISLILPDDAVFQDVFTVPALRGKQLETALESSLRGTFRDRENMKIQTFCPLKTKQQVSYCITGIRSDILAPLRAAFASAKLDLAGIITASEADVHGFSLLHSKTKGHPYLLMNVEENRTRIVWAVKGEALGSFLLPFGYEMLEAPGMVEEASLFNHAVAKAAIARAKELAKMKLKAQEEAAAAEAKAKAEAAKAKAAAEAATKKEEAEANGETVPAPVAPPPVEKEEVNDSDSVDLDEGNADEETDLPYRLLDEKKIRRLPQYLKKKDEPLPQTQEEFCAGNFRIFAKWALCLLHGNGNLSAFGNPDNVYVNIPAKYNFAIEEINKEAEENKISFRPVDSGKPEEVSVSEHLTLSGGLILGRGHNLF